MPNGIKTFVIDTNVLIHRPDAILSFRDNEIVIPLWVLEELDKLKSFSDEKGRNARHAIRFLDTVTRNGRFDEGVKLENGSVLRVGLTFAKESNLDLAMDKMDNRIIMCALELQKQGKKVIFVSKDINARVKATAIGLKSVDYEKQKVEFDKLYPGFTEVDVGKDLLDLLNEQGASDVAEHYIPNQFFVFRNKEREKPVLARYRQDLQQFEKKNLEEISVCGVKPLNLHQEMAFDLLLDPTISLVTLVGKAGTGKTLLAIAAGLHLAMEQQIYNRVLVSRPVIPMGKDIGYLPGAKGEKLSHWMQPLFDNLEYILSVYRKPHLKTVDQLMASKNIEVEALAFIRGRSLPGQFIIIDEAQNLSPHEIKTIVSRAGEGAKVVLTGDPYQIDNPYLDSNSNGLTYLVEAFKGQELFGHVTFQKSERSKLAELAAELL